MSKGNNFRLLQLRAILFKETDEDNELDITELKQKLTKLMNVKKIDNRTIRTDLQSLQEMDFEVVLNRKHHGKIHYSHQDKLFETYQTRLLIDAILSARFITKAEKIALIKKLKELTSVHIAKTLPEPIVFSQTRNLDFSLIKLNIDRIHHAITQQQVLSYQYGSYNVNREFELRYEGATYYVEPYGLIWHNDQYYLIGKSQKNNEVRNYRLDRMRNIKVTAESFVIDKSFDLQAYVDNSFQMFGGEVIEMKLRVKNRLINVMLDRFGMDVETVEDGTDYFIITAEAKLSDGLIGWILNYGAQVKVLSPETLKQKVVEKITAMTANYK